MPRVPKTTAAATFTFADAAEAERVLEEANPPKPGGVYERAPAPPLPPVARPKTTPVPERVLGFLSSMTCEGRVVKRYPSKLDRKDYEALDKVLVALGGKWSRKLDGHEFPEGVDAAELLDRAIVTGEVVDPRANDAFYTPPELASRVVELADVRPGHRVLEPSAGRGALLAQLFARDVPRRNVFVVELLEANRIALEREGWHLSIFDDFLAMPRDNPELRFDRVVMNPPFSKRQDVQHISHAFELLRPGGRLVAVASAGVVFRQDALTMGFRALVGRYGRFEPVEDGAFRASGTDVRTVLVVLEKPEAG